MKKPLLKKIKKLLEEEKQVLLLKLEKESNLIDIDISGDEVDIIQGKILALTDAKLNLRNKERVAKIDLALKKIGKGEFGNCEDCGEEIAEKRLLFNPSFVVCISCAEAQELREKQR